MLRFSFKGCRHATPARLRKRRSLIPKRYGNVKGVAFNGHALDEQQAKFLISQGQNLLSQVSAVSVRLLQVSTRLGLLDLR
jgi:hypothetical protein